MLEGPTNVTEHLVLLRHVLLAVLISQLLDFVVVVGVATELTLQNVYIIEIVRRIVARKVLMILSKRIQSALVGNKAGLDVPTERRRLLPVEAVAAQSNTQSLR